MNPINFRFYENKLPSEDDFVMVRITEVDNKGATCILLEYGGIQGYLPQSQYTKGWTRSLRKLAKVGNEEILQVMAVNPETNAIDLTKKRIAPEDIETALQHYRSSKRCHSIFCRIAHVCDNDNVGNVYQSFGWRMFDNGDHPLAVMKLSLNDPSVWDNYTMSQKHKTELIKIVLQRVKLEPLKYESDIQVQCYDNTGVQNLQVIFKEACDFDKMNTLNALVTEKYDIIIKTSPLYTIICTSLNDKKAIATIQGVSTYIEEQIEASAGSFLVVSEPQVNKN